MSGHVSEPSPYEALFSREFGEAAGAAMSRYWPSGPFEMHEAKVVHQALGKMSNDLWYFAGTHYMSQLLAQETPVFSYSFGGLKHSPHGSDAMYWRGLCKGTLPALMSTYLANFARSGDPNVVNSHGAEGAQGAEGAEALPIWEAWEPRRMRRMHLGNPPEMQETEEAKWYQLLAQEFFSKVLLQRVAVECQAKRVCVREEIARPLPKAQWINLDPPESPTLFPFFTFAR